MQGHAEETFTMPARFWAKVEPGRRDDECWLWGGSVLRGGYGAFWLSSGTHSLAHRTAYELEVGPIPAGMELDHLCFTPACVNPAHLEPVTGLENSRRTRDRKTHCPKGHAYTSENIYRDGAGYPRCRECKRIKWITQDAPARRRARAVERQT